LARYVKLAAQVHADSGTAPVTVSRAAALKRVIDGEPIEAVAVEAHLSKHHLARWFELLRTGGFYRWLGKEEPNPLRLERARAGVTQMVLASMAESHFEDLAYRSIGFEGFTIEDERVSRTDTDYRLFDSIRRAVLRFNIKFHGTLFREAEEYVGLPPEDCFALATYKIHGALKRQDKERLPYVFLIISVPDFPKPVVQAAVSDHLAWLASISGRETEEAIAEFVAGRADVEEARAYVRRSQFRAISARRADKLLRENLFERVHALRLRAFNRTFRGAEINMHLSLSTEMIGFKEFLDILATQGMPNLSVRLDRGEI